MLRGVLNSAVTKLPKVTIGRDGRYYAIAWAKSVTPGKYPGANRICRPSGPLSFVGWTPVLAFF